MKLLNEEEFNNLPKNEQRVAIAKDVIARLNSGNIKQRHGQIFEFAYYGSGSGPWDISFKDFINDNNNGCEACAKGAIMCSVIGNFNKISYGDTMDVRQTYRSSFFPERILDIFPVEMLDNIEAAFEGSAYGWHYNAKETKKYAHAYRNSCKVSDRPHIIDIMNIIIKNDGEFPLPTN